MASKPIFKLLGVTVACLALPMTSVAATTPEAGKAKESGAFGQSSAAVEMDQHKKRGEVAKSFATAPVRTAYAASEKAPSALSTATGSSRYVEVKFVQNHPVRMRNGALTTNDRSAFVADKALSVLSSDAVENVAPLFAEKEEKLQKIASAAQEATSEGHADLNQWYRVKVKDGADLAKVVADLRAQAVVETAYQVPDQPELPIGNLESKQVFIEGADRSGIDARYAWTIPGGTGKNVTVTDIEYGWTTNHEDLSKLRNAVITKGTPRESYANHGTAVAGELWADRNNIGTTGIVYESKAQLSHATTNRGFNPAAAVMTAVANSKAGDVILLEQQVKGCGGGFAPVEVMPSVHDAIKTATSRGIHVVEAAGNGNQNLDQACYGGANFPKGKGDSGAIIVGAGASSICGRTARTKMSYSTYGSRVNVQAWGECVYSAGYGDLQGGPPSKHYTRKFSGTSSASPIVTGAVAALSSIAQERGKQISTSDMRNLIRSTGTPQAGGGGKIGPLPNLRAAIAKIGEGSKPVDPEKPVDPVKPDPVKPDPVKPAPGCDNYGLTYFGKIAAGQYMIHPKGEWYTSMKNGKHNVCLAGPAGTDLDLFLQRWNGNEWATVASGQSDDANEAISYDGEAGYYRVVAFSPYKGAGDYKVGLTNP